MLLKKTPLLISQKEGQKLFLQIFDAWERAEWGRDEENISKFFNITRTWCVVKLIFKNRNWQKRFSLLNQEQKMRWLSAQHLAQCFHSNIVNVARGRFLWQWKEWRPAWYVGLVACYRAIISLIMTRLLSEVQISGIIKILQW